MTVGWGRVTERSVARSRSRSVEVYYIMGIRPRLLVKPAPTGIMVNSPDMILLVNPPVQDLGLLIIKKYVLRAKSHGDLTSLS